MIAKATYTPAVGDYVLATKWQDGDPLDPWAIGFYSHTNDGGRHVIVDGDGAILYSIPGFRRVKKISAKRGAWLLARVSEMESSGKSLWYFVRCSMKETDK